VDTDPITLYRDAATTFARLVDDVAAPDWPARTACAGWTVRDLVTHVVEEDLWAQGLFAGLTIEQAGSRLPKDALGENPAEAARAALAGALAAAEARDVHHHTVHLSVGETPAGEYAMQLFADHLVHAWDLATALGRPYVPDPAHVRTVLDWFGPHEQAYRDAGLIGPRPPLPAGADAVTTLLAAFGRTP
jgi:uncharacterized protein (TIGR03086 family)